MTKAQVKHIIPLLYLLVTASNLFSQEINYADYARLLEANQLAELLTTAPDKSKYAIVLSVLRANNTVWRVSNGGQYAYFAVPPKFLPLYNENEYYYLFLVNISVRGKTRTVTAASVIPLTATGIPNERDGKTLRLRTSRDFNFTGFIHEYLINKNNPTWVNPIKQVPDVSKTKYGKYLKWLGGSSLYNAADGVTGYFIADGVNQYQVRNTGTDGSGWFPLKLVIDTFYFKETDRETLLKREFGEGNGGILLLIKKVKGTGSRSDRAEVEGIILLQELGMHYTETTDVDVEMKVAEYFLKAK